MATRRRRDENKRESWFVTNLTTKTISIGDLGHTVPEFSPGQTHDILRFVDVSKAGHSSDLVALKRMGWIKLVKKRPNSSAREISTADISDEIIAATKKDRTEDGGVVGGGGGAGGSIGDLDDVNIAGITDGQFVAWDAVAGEFVPTSSSSTVNDIGDITNVTISGLADNHILTYDAGTTRWINEALTLPSIDSIDNVDITGITDGQIIAWDNGTSTFLPVDQNVSATEFSNLELVTEYELATLNSFKELIYVGDNLTQINIWETSAKLVKIFQKDFTYTGSDLTQIVLTRISDTATLTKDLVYSGGNLASIEITKA